MKAIVLAGGKGTRLHSEKENLPKVLRGLKGKCLIDYCLGSIDFIDKKDTCIVVGYQREKVVDHLGDEYSYAVQEQQLGTGHAVLCAKEQFEGVDDDIIIIYGDMPLIRRETFVGLIEKHKETSADLTILTARVKNILPYGRIIRDCDGKIIDIVEEKDVDEVTRNINELNVGVIVVKSRELFDGLLSIKNNNNSGEYYLTDLSKVFVEKGKRVESFTIESEAEIRGINTLEDLSFAEKVLEA